VTQPDDLERVTGRGRAATRGGAIKSRHIDQIRIGANKLLLKAAVKTLGQRVYTKDRFFSACPHFDWHFLIAIYLIMQVIIVKKENTMELIWISKFTK
jgi:hypothetical protein